MATSTLPNSNSPMMCSARSRRWHETLSRVEQTLAEAMTTAREREHALEEFVQSSRPAEGTPPAWQRGLEESLQRQQVLRAMAAQAGPSVAAAEVALAEGEET